MKQLKRMLALLLTLVMVLGLLPTMSFAAGQRVSGSGRADKVYTDEDSSFSITADGRYIDAEPFQQLYQNLVGLSAFEKTFDKVSGDPVLDITATYADGSGTRRIRFLQVADRRFCVETDGEAMGFITATNMNKMLSDIELVASGKEIS